MKKIIALFALSLASLFAADTANDLIFQQRKADNSGTIQRNVPATAGAMIGFNGSNQPVVKIAGTDYAPATSGSALLAGNGSGGFSNVTLGAGLTYSGGILSNTAPATWGSIGGSLSAQSDLVAALGAKQPLDSDLTAIAALSTTSFGRAFLTIADAAALRAYAALDQVNNTSDANKPISTATQAALDAKAAISHAHTYSDITDFASGVQAALFAGKEFRLSQVLGTYGTADLIGCTTEGTDYTTQIQALLDQATSTHGVRVIVDGRYSVTGLKVRGNTAIDGAPGDGFLLRAASNKPILSNYTLTAGGGTTSQRDFNIVIRGLTLNGNAANQTVRDSVAEGMIVGVRMFGVQDVLMEDVTINNTVMMAAQFNNWANIKLVRVRVNNNLVNQDGIKFNGPGDNCVIRDLDVAAADDAISFCANDGGPGANGVGSQPNYGPYGVPYGDITNVRIDGVNLRSSQGVRLLSTTNRVDSVTVRNITGSGYRYALVVDNYNPAPSLIYPAGIGRFGRIEVDGIYADAIDSSPTESLISVSGAVEQLTLRNISRRRRNYDKPTIALMGAQMRNLVIDGFVASDDHPTSVYSHVSLSNSFVERLTLSNASLSRRYVNPAAINLSAIKLASSFVGELRLSNVWTSGLRRIVDLTSGQVREIWATGIKHENHSTYAAFVNSSGNDATAMHVSSFSGGTIKEEASGTWGTTTGDAFTSPQVSAGATLFAASWLTTGGLVAAYTPDVGSAFSIVAGTWTNSTLTPGAGWDGTGRYYPIITSPNNAAWIVTTDLGTAVDNVAIDACFSIKGQYQFAGVILRYVDINNYDWVDFSKTYGIRLLRYDSGAITVGANTVPATWYVNDTTDTDVRARIVMRGTALTVYTANNAPVTFTMNSVRSAQKVGLQVGTATLPMTIREFVVQKLP